MRRLLTLLAAGACLSLTAAGEPQPTTAPSEAAAVNSPAPETAAPAASLELLPLAAEIAAAKAAFQSKLSELNAAVQQAHDPEQALRLQRQIQQLKLETEIGYLEIQARHARARGMDELAAEAEEIIHAARATAERTPQSAAQAPPPAAGAADASTTTNAQQQN